MSSPETLPTSGKQSRRWLSSRRVLLDGVLRPATLELVDGGIVGITLGESSAGPRGGSGDAWENWGELVVLPGFVDVHVHVNEPGRTDWEGFATATAAAAAGGITTLVDMPLNSVPATTTRSGLAAKLATLASHRAAGTLAAGVGLWGGVVPGNEGELAALWDAGVLGFKTFMVPSGVDEFAGSDAATLRAAMTVLAGLGAPLLAHAELPEPLAAPTAAALARPLGERRRHTLWESSRPPLAEVAAVQLLIDLCRETGCRVHVVHVAAAEVLPLIAAAKAEGLPISAETCPHYLTFCSDDVPDGGTLWKCAPPLRTARDREALWQGLADGTLDLVASDHSPSPPAGKALDSGDFFAAWGGIASLQLLFPVVWTGAVSRGFDLATVSRWLTAAPAQLAGLTEGGRRTLAGDDRRLPRGVIALGTAADLVVVDPDATFVVEANKLHHRHPLTPYAGSTLRGLVRATYRGVSNFVLSP